MASFSVPLVAGVDLGGTAVNYTFFDGAQFLVEGLCEHPSFATQGPEICLQQMADGLKIGADLHGIPLNRIKIIGLGTPGPASPARGDQSKRFDQLCSLRLVGLRCAWRFV